MERTDNMPLWVFLAFSSLNTRKGAMRLIYACAIFTLYCLPFAIIFPDQSWLKHVFLIDDWSWFIMMIPIIIWYTLALKWLDRHTSWAPQPQKDA